MKINRVDLILSANRGMRGNIPPNLRSISGDFNNEKKIITIQFSFDNKPSAQEEELVRLIGTEIIADTISPWDIDEIINVDPYPQKTKELAIIFFQRCEEDWLMSRR